MTRIPPIRPIWISSLAVAVAAITALYVATARTRDSSVNIGFIDFAAIMQESKAGKSINAQLAPKQKQIQEATEAKFKELKQQEAEMKKQRDSLSPDQYEQRNQAFQAKIAEWNAEIQQRQTALNNVAVPGVQKLQQVLRAQLADIAAEDHFVAVLSLEQAYFTSRSLDITSEAIRRLDEKLPDVELRFDKEEK